MDSPVLLSSSPKSSLISASSCASNISRHKNKIFQKKYNFLRFPHLSLTHQGGVKCREYNRKYVVKVVSESTLDPEHQNLDENTSFSTSTSTEQRLNIKAEHRNFDENKSFPTVAGQLQKIKAEKDVNPNFDTKEIFDFVKYFFHAIVRFSRPPVIVHQVISTTSLSLLAIENLSEFSPLFFTNLLIAIIAHLSINLYVNTVNDLNDLEIDKINKSHLPLASGDYSYKMGVIIAAAASILSFFICWATGSWPLFWTIFTLFMLWSAYSINLPMLRWKKSGLLTTMCILLTFAVVDPLGFFLHIQTHVLKKPIAFPRPLLFTCAIMSFYGIAVSQLKDLPDIEGDKKHGVRSFSILLGPKLVFWTCISLLVIGYGLALFVGATSQIFWSKIITGTSHVVLALVLLYHAKSVDLKSKASTTSFYHLIWKLLSAEYLLIPFVR